MTMGGSIYAIGDIHGCLDKLKALLRKIDLDPDCDQLVFLGDYIDRGPHAFEVVSCLIQLKAAMPDAVFLKGNHEEMFAQYLSGIDRDIFVANGGHATLDSYLKHREHKNGDLIPSDHLRFFASLRLYYETDDYIFVHAGLREDVPLELQRSEDLLWIRDAFISSDHDFGKRVIFGHTPFNRPLVQPNKIGVDTGAVYGNRLTCVKLPEVDFFYV